MITFYYRNEILECICMRNTNKGKQCTFFMLIVNIDTITL